MFKLKSIFLIAAVLTSVVVVGSVSGVFYLKYMKTENETGQQKTESRNTCHCMVNCFWFFLDEKNADWNKKII